MRLSEERVHHLAKLMADHMLEKGVIHSSYTETKVAQVIARAMLKELAMEDKIEDEVRRMLASYSRRIEEGSAEWEVLFQKKKEELAQKRGYVL
jgi:hypothetical protein